MAVDMNDPARLRSVAAEGSAPGAGRRYRRTAKQVHLSAAERVQRGKAARADAPRASHAVFAPVPGRPDPVDVLEGQAATRVAELVPIRYGRMLVSPFTFYRGAALVMAGDLAGTTQSGLTVQLCGDAHLMNFGAFASPERRQVFDINDFDETNPGPFEWDVKRLAASFEVAGRDEGYSEKNRRAVLLQVGRTYREAMATFAGMTNLDVWYARLDVDEAVEKLRAAVPKSVMRRAEANLAKTRTRDNLQAFAKLTHVVDGRRRIIGNPPLIVPIEDFVGALPMDEVLEDIRRIIRDYRRTLETDRRHLLSQYEFVDLAHKVVGVGSVGTRAWIALMMGRDDSDPLFLQVKQAQASVLEGFTGRSEYTNSGQRVVAGQRVMQAASDIFLGWQRITGLDGVQRDFYLRQLRDWKGSAVIEGMPPKTMTLYAQLCGWTLARAHARSGDRIAISAYLGSGTVFDEAIADFASAYADQNDEDHAALVAAADSGRIRVQKGI
jgi:uncharacterized protein (DUF2252 family)